MCLVISRPVSYTHLPLHGPVWRSNLVYIINKYDLWSKYEAEGNSVMIAYASIYGKTEKAAYYLANELSKLGVKAVSYTHLDVYKRQVGHSWYDAAFLWDACADCFDC